MVRKVGTLLPDYTVLKLNGAEMKATGTSVKQSVLPKYENIGCFPPYLTDKRRPDVPPALCRTPHVGEV